MIQRDLVDDVLEAIAEAERTQDTNHILQVLKMLKTDLAVSPYHQNPVLYIQNRALATTSEGVIGAGNLEAGSVKYRCLTLNFSRRKNRAAAESLVNKMAEASSVFSHEHDVYVVDTGRMVAGIVIVKESDPDTKHLTA